MTVELPQELSLPLEVTLTKAERVIVEFVGRARQHENDVAGVDEKLVHDKPAWFTHVMGFAAELAFCKTVGVFPDLNTAPRSGGADCTLPSGFTVDVKNTAREDGNLLAPLSKNKNDIHPDIAVLVRGVLPFEGEKQDFHTPAVFSIEGWAWGCDLMAPETIVQLDKPTHRIMHGDLHHVLSLFRVPEPIPWQESRLTPRDELIDFDELLSVGAVGA